MFEKKEQLSEQQESWLTNQLKNPKYRDNIFVIEIQ